jgi:hypothetical protein
MGARLLGAVQTVAASLGAQLYPGDRPVRDRALTTLAVTLGEQRLAAAREAGRPLTIEETVTEEVMVSPARPRPEATVRRSLATIGSGTSDIRERPERDPR